MSEKLIRSRKIGSRKIVNRIDEILRICEGKRVLHLGCADYPFTSVRGDQLLHKRLDTVAGDLWGMDVSDEGITALKDLGFEQVIAGDSEQLDEFFKPGQFDVIVAGEIIEHLGAPAHFLKSIKMIMDSSTELILTTINAFSFKSIAHSFLRKEKVHEDHNYYFSYYTLDQLLKKCGFCSNEIYYAQEIQGTGISLFIDRTLAIIPRISPVFSDSLFVRSSM